MDESRRRRWRALWRLPYLAKLLSRKPPLPGMDTPLPQDLRLAKGTLSCGTRYLAYVNRKPRHRAILRLVVQIGSLVEEDDQLGIAHLIEHLVFRGTPSFPCNELKRFIERCGMTFGADLNAETGMEQTSFTLEVPLGKSMKLLKTALQILREFAFEALLKSSDIDLEKGVVEEEWRCRLGVEQRMEETFWQEIFGNSLHASRLPIGKMDVLRACPHDRIRQFYKTWYRPENMWLICVGDFATNHYAVDLIKEVFSGVLPSSTPPLAIPEPPLQATCRASIAFRDEELTRCQVRLRVYFTDAPRKTRRNVVGNVTRELLTLAANRRLTAMQGRCSPPFVAAMLAEENISQNYNCMVFTATAMQGSVGSAVEAIAAVCSSLARYGLLTQELALVKRIQKTGLESSWAERHHSETDDIVEALEEHASSKGEASLCSDAMDVRLQLAALEEIGLPLQTGVTRCLASEARQLFSLSEGNWSVEAEVSGTCEEDNSLNSSSLQELVAKVERKSDDEIGPFVWEQGEILDESMSEEQLILNDESPMASIVKNDPLQYPEGGRHFVLSNGCTVTWMRTDFEPDEILIRGTAIGGISELPQVEEQTAALMMTSLRMLCGLSTYSKSQLEEVLADKDASMLPAVGNYTRNLSGSSGASRKDFETALRLASLHFAPPNFTQASFQKMIEVARQRIKNQERDPNYHLQKKLRELTCGNHPFFQELDLEDLKKVEAFGLDAVRNLYARLFSDPGEWSWVIVGALPDEETLHELAAKYLGIERLSEETATATSPLTLHLPVFTATPIVRMYHGMAEAASACICFGLMPSHFMNAMDRLAATCAAEVAEARILEKLRMTTGATYSVSCSVSFGSFEVLHMDRRPAISIDFGCDPARVQECVDASLKELQALVSTAAPITQEELDSCKEKERERLKSGERENSRWGGRLNFALLRARCGSGDVINGSIAHPVGAPCGRQEVSLESLESGLLVASQRGQRIEDLTQSALQETVVNLFPSENSIIVVLLPEKFSAEAGAPESKRQKCQQ